jgi:hypothetical protein
VSEFRHYLQEYGTRMPTELLSELGSVEARLNA